MIAALGGRPFSVETGLKPLYHASAVMACGHVVALIDAAVESLARCGLTRAEAKETLLPLISSTIENLGRQTTSEALTGTFARADSQTFERHVEALGTSASVDVLSIYLLLGKRSLELARSQGADEKGIRSISDRIEELSNGG
jgi:predicted short-subunit dehydrogenase-like oxidoreductase (DUF2520 family)